MAIKIYPYKAGSRSARALADALGGRVLRKRNSTYRQRPQDLIINWGASDSPFVGPRVANHALAVNAASNKLTSLRMLEDAGIRVPPFWTRREDIPADAYPVVCRTILNGSGGRGIVITNDAAPLVNAPLYTKYIKKQDEYRIHCFRTPGHPPQVLSTQRKARRNGEENVNYQIRNLENGFVFVRDGVHPPQDVITQATSALEALSLAFGAVDVIWNNHLQQAFVLEVNTAPGLEGQTVEDYANAFRLIA
jgi:D-alanine-D-alanine ligase-like ATP-grasp enzyme